jgi:hypothetical protein
MTYDKDSTKPSPEPSDKLPDSVKHQVLENLRGVLEDASNSEMPVDARQLKVQPKKKGQG